MTSKRELENKIEETARSIANTSENATDVIKLYQKELFGYIEQYKKEVGYNEDTRSFD